MYRQTGTRSYLKTTFFPLQTVVSLSFTPLKPQNKNAVCTASPSVLFINSCQKLNTTRCAAADDNKR